MLDKDKYVDKKSEKKVAVKTKLKFFLIIRILIVSLMSALTSGIVVFILSRIIRFRHEQAMGIVLLLLWFVICIGVSNFILYKITKITIITIQTINEATVDVAKGNFDVRITTEKSNNLEEIRNMYANFNNMVKELSTIETLRNDFVADVSHEFKTPISAIEGYAMLLQDENISKEEKKEYIESIIYNSKRLNNLTSNILMISKLENDSVKIKSDYFDLDEQIRRIILTFEEKWIEKNLELDIELDAVKYYGDEDLLYNVWLNLISNAIKFSNNEGILKIRLTESDDLVKVSIKDNGIGMSEETKNRIYEKFYQGDSSRTYDGNGLGMTLVSKILEICGGKIKIDSKTGQGTLFEVTLPKSEFTNN